MGKPKYERSYLGITITKDNYREIMKNGGRDEINYHTKHLRAYLKGKNTFTHGVQKDNDGKILRDMFGKIMYNVHQVLFSLKEIPK